MLSPSSPLRRSLNIVRTSPQKIMRTKKEIILLFMIISPLLNLRPARNKVRGLKTNIISNIKSILNIKEPKS